MGCESLAQGGQLESPNLERVGSQRVTSALLKYVLGSPYDTEVFSSTESSEADPKKPLSSQCCSPHSLCQAQSYQVCK